MASLGVQAVSLLQEIKVLRRKNVGDHYSCWSWAVFLGFTGNYGTNPNGP